MSRTVSFRASEELDEFLEEEAERRMTTKSTVAQMLVAERVRQLQLGEIEDEKDIVPEALGSSEPDSDTVDSDDDSGLDEKPEIFERCSDKWHVPDSKKGNKYAVRTADGELMYYKTERGAAQRLREEYGG